MKKIGLLGGTFDPVHNGHLQLGQIVLDSVGLDQVLFIPAAYPPHKNDSTVSGSSHRLEMLRLALDSRDGLEISEIEMGRRGLSYTYDTLKELKRSERRDETPVSYHFIIGFDAIAEIETWYRWQELLVSINFIVAVRPGYSVKEIEALIGRNGFNPESEKNDRWVHREKGNQVLFLADQTVDISSTDIREKICCAGAWRGLVPEKVADYIITNDLYDTMR